MVWDIPPGQLGLAAWLCSLPVPAHLLIARHRKQKEVLDFLATTKTVSVLSTSFSY